VTDLPTHKSECPSCHGTKRDPDACEADVDVHDDICPECPECPDCDGTGKVHWEWRHEETEACGGCTERAQDAACAGLKGDDWRKARLAAYHAQPEVPCARYGEDGETAICLPCALALHAAVCGCDKWPKGVHGE